MSSSASNAKDTSPVYFWKPEPEDTGYLCQWYISYFEVDGITYNCNEQWMMAGKARLFKDDATAHKILKEKNPRKHKQLGRQVENFNVKKWEDERYNIVLEGNYHKFTKGQKAEELRAKLLATGDRLLVEASPFDPVWGIGLKEAHADHNNQKHWGLNLLGKALMEVRQRLRDEANPKPTEEEGASETAETES